MSLQKALNRVTTNMSSVNRDLEYKRKQEAASLPSSIIQPLYDEPIGPQMPIPDLYEAPEMTAWEDTQVRNMGGPGSDLLDKFTDLSRMNREQSTASALAMLEGTYHPIMDQERHDLENILRDRSGENFENYLAYADMQANKDKRKADIKWSEQFAKEHPHMADALSVPMSLLSGAQGLNVATQKAKNAISGKDIPIDWNAGAGGLDVAQTVRSTRSKDMSGLGSFAYNTAMSMADTAGTIALSAMGIPNPSLFLGGSAASSAMQDAKQRGASDNQAIGLGVIAGIAETVTEKIGLDRLFKGDASAPLIKRMVRQAIPEGAEEVVTSVANAIADEFVMGDKSASAQQYQAYLAQGMDQDEAYRKAMGDFAKGLAMDFAGGAVSGGIFGAFQKPAQQTQQYATTDILPDIPGVAPEAVQGAVEATIPEPTQVPTAQQNVQQEAPVESVAQPEAPKQAPLTPLEQAMQYAKTEEARKQDVDDWTPGSYGYFRHIDAANDFDVNRVLRGRAEKIGANPETIRLDIDDQTGNAVYSAYGPNGWVRIATDVRPEVSNSTVSNQETIATPQQTTEETSAVTPVIPVTADILPDNNAVDILPDRNQSANPGNMVGQDTNVPSSNQSVEPNNMGEGVGDMGAKTSDFRREDVKMGKGSTNTLNEFENQRNVPEEQKIQNKPAGEYTVRHMDEVVHNANMRLEQDYDGEVAYLEDAINWTDEDVAMSKTVSDNLLREAKQTGDYTAYNKWMKGVRERQTTSGQSVNAWKLYKKNSYEGIMAEAAALLENAPDGTDVDAVMSQVSDLADQFEAAIKAGNAGIDNLVEVIKRTARARRTGTFFKNRFPKEAQWAIDRIAAYAKEGLAKQGTPVLGGDTTASRFKVGDTVRANDRGNYGKIVEITDDGKYVVHFVSKEGATANVTFDKDTIESTMTKEVKASDIAESPDAAYEFLRNFAASGIKNIAGDTNKSSIKDKAMDFRRNAMLSKISTTLRNLVGNGVFDPLDSVAVNASVILDRQLAKMTGTRSTAVDKSWASEAKRKGSMDGLAMAILEVALDVDASGTGSKYEAPSNRSFKMSENTLNRILSEWDKFMGYALNTTDEFQKGGIQSEVQRGIDELYEQGKIKDDSLKDAGANMAKYRTFQGDSKAAKAVMKIREAGNSIHDGLGDFLIPFAQVPANLAAISADYSPVGLIHGAVDVVNVLRAAKSGDLTAAQQAKAVHEVGRGLTGSGLIAIFAALAKAGILHVANPGGDDENRDKAAIEKLKGFSGTQLNTSAVLRWAKGGDPSYQEGDELVQIGFLDPINAQMTTGALIADEMTDDMDTAEKAATALKASFDGTLQAVMDLPVMDTLRDTQMAYQRSDAGTEGGKLADAAVDYGLSGVASFIPNAVRGIAEGSDPYVRDMYSKDTALGRFTDKVKGSIPGKYGRESLPVKLDPFGQPIKNHENEIVRELNANVNPGRITEYNTDSVIEGMDELNAETGSNALYPRSKAPKSFTVNGEDFELTYEQQQKYKETAGQIDHKNREALYKSDSYKKMPSDVKLKANEKAESYANEMAKAALNPDYEVPTWVKNLDGKSPKEIADYINNSTLISDAENRLEADGEKHTKYKALSDLLGDGLITEETVRANASTTFNEPYDKHLAPKGVSMETWAEAYSLLPDLQDEIKQNAPMAKAADVKREAIDRLLDNMDLPKKDEMALLDGLYEAYTLYSPYDTAPKAGMVADRGGSNEQILAKMTPTQQQKYKYYLGNFSTEVPASAYQREVEYKDSLSKLPDGTPIKEQFIQHLRDSSYSNAMKRKIYCAVGYSENTIPKEWK